MLKDDGTQQLDIVHLLIMTILGYVVLMVMLCLCYVVLFIAFYI